MVTKKNDEKVQPAKTDNVNADNVQPVNDEQREPKEDRDELFADGLVGVLASERGMSPARFVEACVNKGRELRDG